MKSLSNGIQWYRLRLIVCYYVMNIVSPAVRLQLYVQSQAIALCKCFEFCEKCVLRWLRPIQTVAKLTKLSIY
jgi:hypothetical protein